MLNPPIYEKNYHVLVIKYSWIYQKNSKNLTFLLYFSHEFLRFFDRFIKLMFIFFETFFLKFNDGIFPGQANCTILIRFFLGKQLKRVRLRSSLHWSFLTALGKFLSLFLFCLHSVGCGCWSTQKAKTEDVIQKSRNLSTPPTYIVLLHHQISLANRHQEGQPGL